MNLDNMRSQFKSRLKNHLLVQLNIAKRKSHNVPLKKPKVDEEEEAPPEELDPVIKMKDDWQVGGMIKIDDNHRLIIKDSVYQKNTMPIIKTYPTYRPQEPSYNDPENNCKRRKCNPLPGKLAKMFVPGKDPPTTQRRRANTANRDNSASNANIRLRTVIFRQN